MPQIINPYSPDDSLAKSLTALAGGLFGDQAKNEAYRAHAGLYGAQAAKQSRENLYIFDAAKKWAQGDTPGAMEASILSGMDAKNGAGWNQLGASNRATSVDDPNLALAQAGNSMPAASTFIGQGREEANKRAIAQMTTDRQMRSAEYQADTTPQTVLGEDGFPVITSRKAAIEGRMPAVRSKDEVIGSALASALRGQQQAQPAAPSPWSNLPMPDGSPSPVPGNTAGVTPMNPNVDPFRSMPPSVRRLAGVEISPHGYRAPDGSLGTSGDNMSTDMHSGKPLPPGTMPVNLTAQNMEGLTGNPAIDTDIAQSRTATKTAIAHIDRLSTTLSAPNADQSRGYIGTMGSLYNDLRSQVEAGARLVGGEPVGQAFTSPELRASVQNAANKLFENPAMNAKALQLGINHAIINSQVIDLAYTIAKTRDPKGAVSVRDVDEAARTIGATLMDPNASKQVLSDLRQRMIDSQVIREQETKRTFPGSKFDVTNPNYYAPTGTAPAPAPVQAAGAPAAPPPNVFQSPSGKTYQLPY